MQVVKASHAPYPLSLLSHQINHEIHPTGGLRSGNDQRRISSLWLQLVGSEQPIGHDMSPISADSMRDLFSNYHFRSYTRSEQPVSNRLGLDISLIPHHGLFPYR